MGEAIVEFLNTWSPLDLVLIAQNFDRFLWGALVTLQLTFISLIIGGMMSIPLAIITDRDERPDNGNHQCRAR